MKRVQLSDMPQNALVWRRDVHQAEDIRGLVIPPGYEAVIYHAGDYLGPFRQGDVLSLPGQGGWFRRRAATDSQVYFCRQRLDRPLYWGLGSLPAPGGAVFGASGQLRLSLDNAMVLVRGVAAGQERLDDAGLGRRLESLVVGHVRPALIEVVERMGLTQAQSGLTLLARRVEEALEPQLSAMGLGCAALLIENLIINKEPA